MTEIMMGIKIEIKFGVERKKCGYSTHHFKHAAHNEAGFDKTKRNTEREAETE